MNILTEPQMRAVDILMARARYTKVNSKVTALFDSWYSMTWDQRTCDSDESIDLARISDELSSGRVGSKYLQHMYDLIHLSICPACRGNTDNLTSAILDIFDSKHIKKPLSPEEQAIYVTLKLTGE